MTKRHLSLNQLITLQKLLVIYVDDVKGSFESDDELFDFLNVLRHVQKSILLTYNS